MTEAVYVVLIGSVATSLLACLGFWITYKTSTATMQRAMLQNAAIKHADFILKWITELREDTARYVKLHQNVMLARRSSPSGKVPRADRDVLLDLSEVRARLKMMIKKDSQDASEQEFLELIEADVDREEEIARKQRLRIIDASREVQKNAWREAKDKITDPNTKET